MDKTKALDPALSQIERAFENGTIMWRETNESTGLAMIEAIEPEAELFALAEQVDIAEKAFHDALARRNEAQIATIAVGAISEADHANSILAAGRADLCAIARPHLADPAWTLHEAARIGVKTIAWPKQYATAKGQYEANLARAAAAGAEAK